MSAALLPAGVLGNETAARSWSRVYRDATKLTEAHAIRATPDGNFVLAGNVDAQMPTPLSALLRRPGHGHRLPINGKRVHNLHWPLGLPPGLELVLQYLVIDPT